MRCNNICYSTLESLSCGSGCGRSSSSLPVHFCIVGRKLTEEDHKGRIHFLTSVNQKIKSWHNNMLLTHSECLVCTQTANLRLAASPRICYGDQRLRNREVQIRSFEKQVGGCDDMAHQIQARSLDLGPPDPQVWIPFIILW